MNKYYDKKTRSETHIKSNTTIISTDKRVVDFFKPLKVGFKLKYTDDNLPLITKLSEPSEDSVLEKKTNQTQFSLMSMCDNKQEEVQKLVLGYKSTPLQLERYKDKFQRATEGEFSDVLNKAIITKHKKYLSAIRELVDVIEYFRGEVDDLIIEGEFDKANQLIEAAKKIGVNATLEDIKGLFI